MCMHNANIVVYRVHCVSRIVRFLPALLLDLGRQLHSSYQFSPDSRSADHSPELHTPD